MLLSKTPPISYGVVMGLGFNPYFSGCFSLSSDIYLDEAYKYLFQSLFFWMLLSKLAI